MTEPSHTKKPKPEESLDERFQREGYLVLEQFASKEEVQGMKQRMKELIDEWDGKCVCSFSTDESQTKEQGNNDYFLDSADQVHFFLEKDAIDEESGGIKKDVSKHTSLNKVGHGLHLRDRVFREYANSDKVVELTKTLGYKSPVLPQSMYIFKNPGIGGEVTSHQDASFLYTTPRQTCLGLWLALDDATLDNGCLWARVGSHKEPVRRHLVRNPEYFEKGNTAASQMIFETFDVDVSGAKMEGKAFEEGQDPKEFGFTAVPIKAGDLFVIHGEIDHMSLPNVSNKPRETFQLHLIEGPDEGITWSPKNWMQYPEGTKFPKLGEIQEA